MGMKEFGTRTFFEDTIALPSTSGKGIKLGSFSPGGDNARFGWRAVPFALQVLGSPSVVSPQAYSDPTWARIGGSIFYAYSFALNNSLFVRASIPHDIVPASSVHLAVAWVADSAASPQVFQARAVTFAFDYMYSDGFAQSSFAPNASVASPAQAAVNAAATGSTTAYKHITAVSAAVAMSAEPGGVFYSRLKRISNTTSPISDNTNTIFLLSAAMYYQSTNLATKQKEPDFYAE